MIYSRGLSDTDRHQQDFRLFEPPPWEVHAEPSPEVLASDAAAFMAAAAAVKGGRA